MFDFLRFYNRPQRYKAEIRIDFRNIGKESKKVHAIVPLPRTTEYQKTKPVFEKPTEVFDFELKPGMNERISVQFEAEIMPRKYEGKISPEIVRANEFVIDYLTYGNPIDGLYTADEARTKRIVDCGGFDTLLQDELKKLGIESKVVAGFWNTGEMHAWLEIAGNLPADPSIEKLRRQGRTKRSGKLGFVGSDRIAFSIGEPFYQKPIVNCKHEYNLLITRS